MIAGRSALLGRPALGPGANRLAGRARDARTPRTRTDDFSTPHRASALKAAGAVLAVAVVPLALVVGHLPDRRPAAATAQPAAASARPSFAPAWVAVQTGTTSRITLNTRRRPAGRGADPGTRRQLRRQPRARPPASCSPCAGSTGGAAERRAGLVPSGSIGVKEKKSGTSCYQVDAPTRVPRARPRRRGCARPSAPTPSPPPPTSTSSSRAAPASSRRPGWAPRSSAPSSCRAAPASVCRLAADHGTVRLQPAGRLRAGQRGQRQLPLADQRPVVAGRRRRHLLRHPHAQGRRRVVLARGRCRRRRSLPAAPTDHPERLGPRDRGRHRRLRWRPARHGRRRRGRRPQVTVYRLDNVGTDAVLGRALHARQRADNSARSSSRSTARRAPSSSGTSRLAPGHAPTPSAGTTELPESRSTTRPRTPQGNSPDVTLGWCPERRRYDGRRHCSPGYTAAQVAALTDDQDDFVGTQYACVISRTAQGRRRARRPRVQVRRPRLRLRRREDAPLGRGGGLDVGCPRRLMVEAPSDSRIRSASTQSRSAPVSSPWCRLTRLRTRSSSASS